MGLETSTEYSDGSVKNNIISPSSYTSGAFSLVSKQISKPKEHMTNLSAQNTIGFYECTRINPNSSFGSKTYYAANLILNLGAISVSYGNSNTVQPSAIHSLIIIKI